MFPAIAHVKDLRDEAVYRGRSVLFAIDRLRAEMEHQNAKAEFSLLCRRIEEAVARHAAKPGVFWR